MLRRNFLSFLGLSPVLSFFKNNNQQGGIIHIPKDVVYRVEYENGMGRHIEYKMNGRLHNENGPAHITDYVKGSRQLIWGTKEIGHSDNIYLSASTMEYRQWIDKTKPSFIQFLPDEKIGLIYGEKFQSYKDVDTRWFEQQVGMTIEQIRAFN